MTTTVTTISNTTTSVQVVAANPYRSSLRLVLNGAISAYLLQGEGTASATNKTETLDAVFAPGARITPPQSKEAFQVVFASAGAGSITVTETTSAALAGPGTKSILTICQELATRIGIEVPDQVFASSDRTLIELKEIVNDTARMIARAHRWRNLLQEATYPGDGTTEDFDLPDDFDWMPDAEKLWGATWQQPLLPVRTTDEWLGLDVRNFNTGVPAWIIYGRQVHIKPALASGDTARHFYQSSAVCEDNALVAKAAFTLDTDLFRLDERLLKLGVIWRWKMGKGQPYAEQLDDFESYKEKLITADKGATIIRVGAGRMARGTSLAYPLNVPTS